MLIAADAQRGWGEGIVALRDIGKLLGPTWPCLDGTILPTMA